MTHLITLINLMFVCCVMAVPGSSECSDTQN